MLRLTTSKVQGTKTYNYQKLFQSKQTKECIGWFSHLLQYRKHKRELEGRPWSPAQADGWHFYTFIQLNAPFYWDHGGPFYDQSRGTNYFLFRARTILVRNVAWRCAQHNVLINATNFQFDLSEKQQSEALWQIILLKDNIRLSDIIIETTAVWDTGVFVTTSSTFYENICDQKPQFKNV